MLDAGIPSPGPQPEALEFPFEVAQRAMAALRAAIEDLGWFRDRHGEAATQARVGFEGQVRQGFDQALDDALAEANFWLGELEADLDELQRLVALARSRIEARNDAIAAWQQHRAAYDQAMDAARRAAARAGR